MALVGRGGAGWMGDTGREGQRRLDGRCRQGGVAPTVEAASAGGAMWAGRGGAGR
jgi:hypothetical protein